MSNKSVGVDTPVDSARIKRELADRSALLIDVRGTNEWDSGHARGAIHLPVEDIIRGQLPTIAPNTKLYLYCRSGVRAAAAASYLAGSGRKVENIGGLNNWRAGGGAIV